MVEIGRLEFIEAPEGVLAFRRYTDDDERIVIVSFVDTMVRFEIGGEVVVASDGVGVQSPFSGRMVREQAVILRP